MIILTAEVLNTACRHFARTRTGVGLRGGIGGTASAIGILRYDPTGGGTCAETAVASIVIHEEKIKGAASLILVGLRHAAKGEYSEAIAVLYGTNRFHFQSDSVETIKSFPLTFLPQRLATITAVDIFWHQSMRPGGTFLYTHLWDGISLMTNVRSLRINLVIFELETNPLPPDSSEQTKRAVESEWLGPVDELVGRLGSQLEEFSFLVSSTLYSTLQGLGNEEEVLWGYAYENLKCFTRVIGGNEYVINEWTDHRMTWWR
ncbi:hypothetical protein V502_02481 [Pseudogymnoascus sp. VKM F-4520 (FW-2644)]|nr:hypothetical protein V502_02481 [Pseudogymnoascus sp. VKM F-4520 (FW-2644)]